MMRCLSLILILVMLLPCVSVAESAYTGYVVAGEKTTICASYGGHIIQMPIRPGMLIHSNALIAEIGEEQTYAPIDGTVTAVFADVHDMGENIKERYGAVLWIEPEHPYTIKCSTAKMAKSTDTQLIHIGEMVYLRNTANRKRTGTGIVIALGNEKDEKAYYVEVLKGEFLLSETISVYRNGAYETTAFIGEGTVKRNLPIAVNVEGCITRLHVTPGKQVQTGDLLLESVKSERKILPESEIRCDKASIVADVQVEQGDIVKQGDVLATLYPLSSLQVEVQFPEVELQGVAIGDTVTVALSCMEDNDTRYNGTVSSISYINTNEKQQGSNTPCYEMRIDFDADAVVRVGMTAVVYFGKKTNAITPPRLSNAL